MTNKRNGTLYIGYTDDLWRRVYEHKLQIVDGFTKKYGLTQLVYYQAHETREQAHLREKQMKAWQRQWKINAIEDMNPHWIDMAAHLEVEKVSV